MKLGENREVLGEQSISEKVMNALQISDQELVLEQNKQYMKENGINYFVTDYRPYNRPEITICYKKEFSNNLDRIVLCDAYFDCPNGNLELIVKSRKYELNIHTNSYEKGERLVGNGLTYNLFLHIKKELTKQGERVKQFKAVWDKWERYDTNFKIYNDFLAQKKDITEKDKIEAALSTPSGKAFVKVFGNPKELIFNEKNGDSSSVSIIFKVDESLAYPS